MTDEPPRLLSRRAETGIDRRRSPPVAKARAALGALALGLALALAACDLDAEKETILIKYDAARDIAHVRLIYEGLHTGNVTAGLAELDRIVQSETIFYLPSDVFGWTEVDAGDPRNTQHDALLDRAFRGRTAVTQGRFFLNGEGKLSAWQDLRLTEVRRIASVFNAEIERADALLQDLGRDPAAGKAMADPAVQKGIQLILLPFTFQRDSRQSRLGLRFSIRLDADGLYIVRLVPPDEDAETLGEPTVLGIEPAAKVGDLSAPTGPGVAFRATADANGVIKMKIRSKIDYQPQVSAFLVPGQPLPLLPRPLDHEATTERLTEEVAAPAFGGDADRPPETIRCLEEDPYAIPSCA